MLEVTRRMLRTTCAIALAAGMVAASGRSAAQEQIPGYPDAIEAFDSREVAMLPNYCKYTQTYRGAVPGGNDPVQIEKWYRALGPTFHALHHYCNGLMRTNRALFLARSARIRNFNLSASIGEFDYVILRAPKDFVLLPEILTKKGENLLRLGQLNAAYRALDEAIAVKPDYWPPYAAYADHYAATGDTAKAREYLEKGLAAAPDTKALKRRLTELGNGRSASKSK